ncbi:hypothetical protein [Roseibium aggregatum]|uniref:Uncharacterized protein n=1 Tax=Roseibium aggregatum TaxID=187304 RepID=A0A926S8Z8_9HYPH|nr:hypothetical protein [Roseibium aggregatum]MBD1549607.1 hypothetical protein [Roseibium aggregatum]
MSVSHTHSCFTTASFQEANWHNVEPLLESWKSLLQGLPGYIGSDFWIRRLENGDVRCILRVGFEHREQLEEFLESRWAPEHVIASLEPQPYDVAIDHFEQHL